MTLDPGDDVDEPEPDTGDRPNERIACLDGVGDEVVTVEARKPLTTSHDNRLLPSESGWSRLIASFTISVFVRRSSFERDPNSSSWAASRRKFIAHGPSGARVT
ncbi:hypothetical protein [Leifsonia sp. P73]|uniref:hypothetical protein n=1 Tax=Leifsonia sp. P73 TaxID=3423959 RepID=UPI003DA43568